jgi:hypothetical protein
MKLGFGLAIALTVLATSSTALALRATDPRAIERAAIQEPQLAPSPVESPVVSTSAVLAANAPWAPAGVEVRAGDQLQISADGRWAAINPRQFAANVSPSVGPDGYAQTAGTKGLLLESANRGALVGRIGENGAPFLIGASFQGVANADGALFVAMNEFPGQFEDNVGRLAINISVTPAPPPPPPPPLENPISPPSPAGASRPDAPPVDRKGGAATLEIPVWVIAAAALGGIAALALLASALFSPRPRGRDGDSARAVPTVTARIASDGVRAQMLAISMRGRP